MKTFLLCLILSIPLPALCSDAPETWIALARTHQATLEKGEIEIISHANGDLGGTGLALMRQPLWALWQVITDYPEYSNFMPRNLYSKVLQHDKSLVVFKTRYESAFPFDPVENESRLQHDTHDPHFLKMNWSAEKTNLEFNRGFWFLIDSEIFSPAVLVVYQTRFSIPWVPSSLAAPSSRKTLVATLQAVRKRAEKNLSRYKNPEIRFAWEPADPSVSPTGLP